MNWHDEHPLALHEIWDRLIKDQQRNELIVSDVIQCLTENRECALLSDRKEHLESIFLLLKHQLIKPENIFLLTGAMSAKMRRLEMAKIETAVGEQKGFLLLATSSLVGEGFDLPSLDTLILAMPISFRGRLIQYAGRIHRVHVGKSDSRIYDYTEDDVPVSISMFRKRIQAYRTMGYRMLDRDT
jgi:superfamily II DNA or RNA helicase